MSRAPAPSRVILTLGVAWLALICWITLRPMEVEAGALLRTCLVCGEQGVPNTVLNVLLYAPLGFALRYLTGSGPSSVLYLSVLSLSVEIGQLWIPGRHVGAVDLVANVLGAVLGSVLAAHRHHWLHPTRAVSSGLAGSWALLVGLWAGLFLAAMSPSVPEGQLFAQWTPVLGAREAYSGRILQASIGSSDLPHGLLPATDRVREELLTGGPLRVTFRAAHGTASLAPILRIVDAAGNEAFQLGVDGTDLVVRLRYRADDLRLARPSVRIAGALEDAAASDTLRVTVERLPGRGYWMTLDERPPVALSIGVGRSWSLLRYPGVLGDGARRLVDAAWTAALFLPIGYWAVTWTSLLWIGAFPLGLTLVGAGLSEGVALELEYVAAVLTALVLGRCFVSFSRRSEVRLPRGSGRDHS